MTDSERPYVVEYHTSDVPADIELRYDGMLQYLNQVSYEFRASFEQTDDDTPLIREYELNKHQVMVASSGNDHIAAYVSLPDGSRILYTYEESARYPVTIDFYDDADSNEPTRTYAPLPRPQNIPTLQNICGYIRGATPN